MSSLRQADRQAGGRAGRQVTPHLGKRERRMLLRVHAAEQPQITRAAQQFRDEREAQLAQLRGHDTRARRMRMRLLHLRRRRGIAELAERLLGGGEATDTSKASVNRGERCSRARERKGHVCVCAMPRAAGWGSSGRPANETYREQSVAREECCVVARWRREKVRGRRGQTSGARAAAAVTRQLAQRHE